MLPLLGAGLAADARPARRAAQRLGQRRVLWSRVVVVAGVLLVPDRPARPGRAVDRRLARAAGHRAGRRPAVRADAAGLRRGHPRGAGVLHRPGHDETQRETPVSIFHPTFLVLAAGVSNAFLAGDLFNLFVSFEILLFASYVLLTLGGTGDADPGRHDLRGGQHALLAAVPDLDRGLVYAATGTVNLAQLAEPHRRPARPASRLVLQLLLLHRLRDQGGGVPAVGLAARQLPDRAGAGHRGIRRPAHQGRRLRDHPHRRPCCSPTARSPTCCMWAALADHGGRHPRRGRPVRHQADAVLHPGQPHRLHDLRHRRWPRRRARPARSSTSRTTSPSRPRCSWSPG